MSASARAWCRTLAAACLLALLVLCVPGTAVAGQIQFSITSTVRVTGTRVEAGFDLKNIGTDPAGNVALQGVLRDETRQTPVALTLAAGGTAPCNLLFSLPEDARGTFPIFLALRYTVPGGAAASAVALATVRTAEAAAGDEPLGLEATAGQGENWARVTVRATSRDPRLDRISLTSHGPEYFTAKPRVQNLMLANGAGEAGIRGEIAAGASSDPFAVFLVAEYDLEGQHHLAQSQILLAPQPAAPARLGLLAAAALLALGLLAAGLPWPRRLLQQACAAERWPILVLEAAALLAVWAILAAQFDTRHLLTATTATGGDTGSHYYTLWYLRNVLLPAGKISSWTPGNYAGFPILQFYFPLPFLLMCLLDLVLPLQTAFKLVTLAGVFLTPLGALLMLRLMRLPFPTPALGAVFTLPFLVNEANSMWGGNILSTLAGEFSYSLSMALSLILIGSLYRGGRTGTGVIRNAVLVFLVGFSHGYTLLFAEVMSLFLLFTPRGFLRRVLYLLKVYALGFCLLAFWLVPLLAFSRYTTPYHTVWTINSLSEVIPPVLVPFVALAGAGAVGLVMPGRCRRWLDGEGGLAPLGFLVFGVLVAGVMFVAAPKLGVVDIRYVPYAQLLCCLIAATVIGRLGAGLSRAGLSWAVLVLALAGTFSWVSHPGGTIAAWSRWNYEGFEAKPAWPLFREICDALGGRGAGRGAAERGVMPGDMDRASAALHNEPRVMFEHSSDHNQFGTTRAFESLPLFARRATLEGLYMQASISAPFVFFLQSEISRESSVPFPQYSYSYLDFAQARKRLELFNVRDLILKSAEAKRAIRAVSGYRLNRTIGEYELWELSPSANRYVVPLALEPVLYVTPDWKAAAYQWFMEDALLDVPLVFTKEPDARERARFRAQAASLDSLPRLAVAAQDCQISEEIGNDEIRIRTKCIGKPHLVKMTYHPNWRVEGADRVYLAAPSFMLIYPEREDVRLRYGWGPADWLGAGLTLLGLAALAAAVPWPRRSGTLWEWLAARWRTSRPAKAMPHWDPAPGTRQTLLVGGSAACALLVAAACFFVYTREPHRVFNTSVAQKDAKRFDEAREGFRRVMAALPASTLAQDAAYYIAICHYLEENDPDAIAAFEDLLARFPRSNWVPEAHYHIGMSHFRMAQRQGGPDAALHEEEGVWAMRLVREQFPGSRYAGHAADRLREHGR